MAKQLEMMLKTTPSLRKATTTVGVDIENIANINLDDDMFVQRNYTSAERDYCETSRSPRDSYAGRWSAKEAVFKSLHVASKGAGAAMCDIEIVHNARGYPEARLHGEVHRNAAAENITDIQISITHAFYTVTADALARRL